MNEKIAQARPPVCLQPIIVVKIFEQSTDSPMIWAPKPRQDLYHNQPHTPSAYVVSTMIGPSDPTNSRISDGSNSARLSLTRQVNSSTRSSFGCCQVEGTRHRDMRFFVSGGNALRNNKFRWREDTLAEPNYEALR